MASEISSLEAEMTFTRGDGNVTIAVSDRFAITVGKNVTVVVLGITINYINATMIHTFNRHHVRRIELTRDGQTSVKHI